YCRLTLDPNTVNQYLSLLKENRAVKNSGEDKPYPDHPERFNYLPQVLSKESVSGRCYWEVEWRGGRRVFISVSFKGISRKGQDKECRKMAEASISVDQDRFTCPVCLDLLKDPVTTPCGHSYCILCINGCWDQEDQRGVYSCPQCRETFTPRPVLRRSNMLTEVVEDVKQKLQAAPCYAGPGDVECDSCTGKKRKASKSCLVCLTSYCEAHLKPHYQSPAFKKHKLVEASKQLQEKICSQHDRLIEIYCRTDQSCICYLCTMDEHRGHDTLAASAERSEKQKQLKQMQKKSQQILQRKLMRLQEVKQTVNSVKSSAQAAVEDSERIFTQLIRSIEKKRSEVTELIRAQEKTELSRAEELLEKLEQEIADLKRRDTELEQLEHTEDHIQFLQSFQSLCVSSGSEDSPSITVHQRPSFDGVRKSLSDLKERLEEFWKQEFSKIPPHDYCRLTLDPNTAHQNLSLSQRNRAVTFSGLNQRYPDHPERFDYWSQVLSKESVSGRCYWEVEWSSDVYDVYISVSYKGVSRKAGGNERWFGHNSQSWSLQCSPSLSFWHNNIQTEISAPSSSRIGVYVDHSAGTLSFYSVSDTMTLLHTVHTTFTQPLYAGFWIDVYECRKMAEASISVDQDRFSCPVCLDLLKDPVTIPCGHSYCMVCINGCWDQEDQRGVYRCPQCRETFFPRPVLRRNNMLAEVVEEVKKKLRAAPPAHCYAGPGDVECDSCTGRKLKAVKSCLVCLASFCEAHLKPHYQSPAFKKHKLVEASKQLQEKICSKHDRLIEIYCRTDQQLICYLCTMDEHMGHSTVAAAAERKEKQNQLKEVKKKSQQRLQQKEKKLQEVKQAVKTLKSSAQAAVVNSERIFTQLICSIEKKRSEVTELIRAQEKTELSGAEELLEKLEQEIADLKRRDTELEQLEHTEDHIQFLQSFQSLCVSSEPEESPSITVHQHLSFDGMRKSLSDLKEKLEQICKQEFSKIPPRDYCRLTLDPNTLNQYLVLSQRNRVATFGKIQPYPDHPERFDYLPQVLSKESCRKMAEASISVDQDRFSCPVCLDLLKDPVAIPCGHSYCMVCINGCWDQEDQRGVYSCPQCRETFTPRPVLRRNNMLAEVVEKLKKKELQAASYSYAGPGDVECDSCTGRKLKAVRSCLVCLASYCEAHLQPHYQSPAFKEHKLVEASKQLQEKICSQHGKLIEIYCRTDQSCICYLCTMDEHRGHDTVAASAERSEKQNQLKEAQRTFQQRLQEKEKKLQEVKQAVKTLKSSAQAAVEDSERIFTQLIRSIEKKRSEVTELIRAQEKTELSGAEELLEKLEQEIADLKRRDTELEQLEHTEDHIQFLQSFQSLCVSSGSEDSFSITVHQSPSFDRVRKSLSDLKERLEEFWKQEFSNISSYSERCSPDEEREGESLPTQSLCNRSMDYCRLTLDPNTLNQYLILSEENRAVTFSGLNQRYSNHPERFNYWNQVLSKESVSGRCYWEVEWSSEAYEMSISVSYKGISRKGDGNEFCECRKMAEASISVDQDRFTCPVCLDLLKDPVTIPCGHSYCMVCINGFWDQEDQRGVYRCPQCRETFTPRPVLRRNNMLAEVVEEVKKKLRAAPPAHCYARPGDVECDSCTGRKLKAVKSCLVCLASYCEAHLKPHYQSPAFKKHKLVEASKQLQEKICSQHDEVMKIYCRTDQQLICYLCTMDEHMGHSTVAAAAERKEKQNQLKEGKKKYQQRLQEKEKKLQEVKQAVKTLKSSAQAAVEDSERIFTQLIRSIEKKRSEVTELIRAQEKTELSGAEELLEKLEQEIADLKRRDTELEQLEHTEDHIQFLQTFQSLCVSSGSEDSPSITVHQHPSFDGVRKSLSDLKQSLDDFWKQEFSKIPPHAEAVHMVFPSAPKTREDFLQYYCQLTLDPNTINYFLSLSEKNRRVTYDDDIQHYPDHPERLYFRNQCRKMATAISVDQDQFTCPVCLDLLKDPVTIPCGHSFCIVCINSCWDQEDQSGVYRCPQCRETFTPRPVLRRNNVIAEVVEKLKKTELQAAPPAPFYAGPGDVECDSCTGRKRKASKSCLVCLTSYCKAHLKPHYQSPAFKKHKLVEASKQLQEKICSQHDEVMKIYCRTDQSFICYLCMLEEHKDHDTVAVAAERSEKQNQLKEVQMKSQQRLQEKEKKLQEVKQAVETLKSSAQAAVEDSERIFTQLIRSIEKKRSEVTELIRAQERTELSRAEEVLEKLEQEIADLKRRDTELEQLEHTEDHIQFLQSFQSVCVPSGSEDSPSIIVHQRPSFDGVRKSLSDLKERLEEFWKQEFSTIPPHDYRRLTLNPGTLSKYLRVSERNRVVTFSGRCQRYPDHPERFDFWCQVLSKQSVSERCYWEVEWSSVGSDVYISVSYEGISRKGRGDESSFGHNSQSWSLQCSPTSLSFWHNNIQTEISAPPSSRIGVYVDHSAGTLSFYSVSDTMTLLHTVHTTFTQPLYAGFWIDVYECRKMAEASISVDQDRFTCPVCLDLLKDPVTTPCGHSYCKVCINGCWDQEDQRRVYSCPQCRETFTPRPVLRRNNMLAEVVEEVKQKLRAAPPAPCYAGPGDVECDFCTGRKLKAVKSCLVCLASFCEAHLKPHYQSPAFKKHKLVEASKQLQEKICSQHDEVMKIYCRTDQQLICYLCTMDEHMGHSTVAAAAERKEKQVELC
ncbi:hypothetical protein NFI96_003441, partial [Prochilodus magdalenae]